MAIRRINFLFCVQYYTHWGHSIYQITREVYMSRPLSKTLGQVDYYNFLVIFKQLQD
jgi:hypothetical protein